MQLILTLLSVVIPAMAQLAYLSYISHEMPRGLFGSYSFIILLIYSFTQLAMALPNQALIRFYHSAKDKTFFVNEYRTIVLFISVFGLLYILLLSLIYEDRYSIFSFIYSGLVIGFICAFSLGTQVLLLEIERKKYLFCKILEALSRFLIPLVMFLFFKSIESLLFGLLLGYVVCYFFVYWNRPKLDIILPIENAKTYTKYAYPIILSTMASLVISFSDRYFIDYFLNDEALGDYSILYQFASFAQIFGVAFSIYVVPIIMKNFENDKRNALFCLNRYILSFLFLLLFVFFIFMCIPTDFYKVFMSDLLEDNSNFIIFIIIMGGVFLSVFQTAMSLYFVLLKRLDVHAKFFLSAAVINFILNFYIEEYGLLAASLSTFVAYSIMTILVFTWLKLNINNISKSSELLNAK